MHILLINPNTSADMTACIAAHARGWCGPGTEISPVTAAFGCDVIASRAAYAIAGHAALDAYARHGKGADAVILACFGDPGLEALREVAPIPVVGLAESTIAAAGGRGDAYAIVTAGRAWIPMLRERVGLTRQEPLFRGVFAVDTTGLDILRDPQRFVGALQGQVDLAHAAGAQSIILGGAALAGFGARVTVPAAIIDPLATAVADAERGAGGEPGRVPRHPCASRNLSPELAALLASG